MCCHLKSWSQAGGYGREGKSGGGTPGFIFIHYILPSADVRLGDFFLELLFHSCWYWFVLSLPSPCISRERSASPVLNGANRNGISGPPAP